MNYIWTCWEILVCIVEAALIVYLYENQLDIKKRYYQYYGFFAHFIIITLCTFYAPHYYMRMFVIYMGCFFYSILAFKNAFSMKFVNSFLPLLISNLSEGIILNLFALLKCDLDLLMKPSLIRFQFQLYVMILSFVFYFATSQINRRLLRKYNIYFPITMRVFVFILLLLACYTIQISSDLTIWLNKVNTQFQYYAAYLSAIMMIFTLSFFILIIWNGILNKKHIEEAIEENRLKNQYERLKDAEAVAEAISIQKHDMHGHLEVMATLINDGKIDELLKYFKNYSELLYETTQHIWMQNPSINACLTVKKNRAATNGIRFNVISKLQRALPLEPIDACSLIGNMLDNAIEACTKIDDREKRYIDLQIIEHRENIIISVENSANNVTSIAMGVSNKDGSRGLGLKQMNALAKKAGGFINIDPKCEKVIVSAVFPIDKEY